MALRRRVAVLAAASISGLGLVALGPMGPASAGVCYGTCSFSADSGVSTVTGWITFTGPQAFTLTEVTLSDTKCDHRSAEFEARTNLGDLTIHTDSKGCGTSTDYTALNATASGSSKYTWVQIFTWACNGGSCSSDKGSTKFTNSFT